MKKISIIVPVYNVENEILRCLNSLLDQNYDNYEVLVIDDGSTDSSGKIAREFCMRFSNFSYFHKKNGGLSDARNYGFRYVTGDILLFVDSDDYIKRNVFYDIVNFFCEEKVDILICNPTIFENNTEKILRRKTNLSTILNGQDYMYQSLRAGDYSPTVWSNIYDTQFLKRTGVQFKKGLLHEDVEWFPKILFYATKVKNIPFDFYYYIKREGSISSSGDYTQNVLDFIWIVNEFDSLLTQYESRISSDHINIFRNYLSESLMYVCSLTNKQSWKNVRKNVDKIWIIRNSCRRNTRIKAMIFLCGINFYRMFFGDRKS